MKKTAYFVQIFLGIVLLFFSLNGFFDIMDRSELGGEAGAFISQLEDAGFVFWSMNLVFLFAGLSLIINRHVALALLFIAPFTTNIVLFHLFLNLSGIVPGLVLFLLNIFLMYVYLDSYRPLCDCNCNSTERKENG